MKLEQMTVQQLSAWCDGRTELTFKLPEGKTIPAHFHLTEIGEMTRRSVDCGGVDFEERYAVAQLWVDRDVDHRLTGAKMSRIIASADKRYGLASLPVVIEYQAGPTTSLYHLEAGEDHLLLTPRKTQCRALDACGLPSVKKLVNLASYVKGAETCSPGGGCC